MNKGDLSSYYSIWHEGYREYKHIRKGKMSENYEIAVKGCLRQILLHCGLRYLEYYEKMKAEKKGDHGLNMDIAINASFFLYEKNYKGLYRGVRFLIGLYYLLPGTKLEL